MLYYFGCSCHFHNQNCGLFQNESRCHFRRFLRQSHLHNCCNISPYHKMTNIGISIQKIKKKNLKTDFKNVYSFFGKRWLFVLLLLEEMHFLKVFSIYKYSVTKFQFFFIFSRQENVHTKQQLKIKQSLCITWWRFILNDKAISIHHMTFFLNSFSFDLLLNSLILPLD